ncbi:MAG: fibronectin type III domain-containing protein [Bacteroidota bacterium]
MSIGMIGTNLTAGSYNDEFSIATFWAANTWHHLVLTYDGTTATLYADGTQIASSAKTWNITPNKVIVGRSVNGNWFWNGQIDDARIYNVALSSTQVAALAAIPPVPTSPSAVAASSSAINLTWTDASTTETGFAIERSTTSGSGYTLVTTTAANATSYSDTGLTASTPYYYRIRAVADNANSAYTSEFTGTTLIAPPAAPTGFTATTASSTRINLSWTDASTTETGFEIERSLTSGSGFVLVYTAGANATSQNDLPLSPGITYYYRMRSKNAGGASSYTAQASATTSGSLVAPSGLGANATTEARILITWTDNSNNETGFAVERATSAGGPFTAVTTKAANSVNFLDAGLTPSTQYYYRVRAVDDTQAAYSLYSNVANATTLPIPAAPTLLTATATSSSTIDLHWTDNSTGETYFVIERSTTSGSGFVVLTLTGAANATSVTDGSLTPGTTYYYRVSAKGQELSSTPSNEASATTVNISAPTALASTNGTNSINLTWTDNATTETNYIVERSIASGTGYTVLATRPANTVSYSDASAVLGTPYYYRVKATNGSGNSNYSNEITATLTATITQLCTNLYCDGLGGVGVGTSSIPSGYRMAIKGKMIAEGVKLDLQMAWPDYVFGQDYKLRDLPSLRSYINQNKHLPGMPTDAEVSKNGIDIGEMDVKFLEKIEEMSLYMIQMEERIRILEAENKSLKSKSNRK